LRPTLIEPVATNPVTPVGVELELVQRLGVGDGVDTGVGAGVRTEDRADGRLGSTFFVATAIGEHPEDTNTSSRHTNGRSVALDVVSPRPVIMARRRRHEKLKRVTLLHPLLHPPL
jgi:hypothetical protein